MIPLIASGEPVPACKPRASGDDPATAITPGRVPRKPRASGDDPTGRPVYVLGPA